MAARPWNWRAVSVSKSLISLVVLTAIFAVGLAVLAVHGLRASGATELLWSSEFRLILAWWVRADRRVRGFRLPFDFDAFVFFAWPVAVPYYLYRSRRGQGLLFAAGIWGLYVTPYLTSLLVRMLLS